jgi:predicted dehydrogenase
MRALIQSGDANVAAIADPDAALREQAHALAPEAQRCDSFDALLALPLDGVVIATPSALHAQQARMALERGLAVFCQKPLGRNASETRQVVEAARQADRLLALDLSYRHTAAMQSIKQLVASGELGQIYNARLVFHNAYGPDKAWYYDLAQAGGGCVVDLGVHLVDLALWTLDFPELEGVQSALYAQGERLRAQDRRIEDFASARLDAKSGTSIEIVCSWNLPAGQDALISVEFYGTRGAAALHNVDGSFYDFRAQRMARQQRWTLTSPPDDWGGRALIRFARQLAAGVRFCAESNELVRVATALDRIYAGAS